MLSVFKNLFGTDEFSFVSVKNYILLHVGARKPIATESEMYSVLDKQRGQSIVLEYLHGEWLLAPAGYRSAEKVIRSEIISGKKVDIVAEARGLDIVIAPNRLFAWCKRTGLTQSQLEPILHTLVSEGFLNSFEFFEGQWSEYDEPETALRLSFDPAFGESFSNKIRNTPPEDGVF